jgi:hypothetical protein
MGKLGKVKEKTNTAGRTHEFIKPKEKKKKGGQYIPEIVPEQKGGGTVGANVPAKPKNDPPKARRAVAGRNKSGEVLTAKSKIDTAETLKAKQAAVTKPRETTTRSTGTQEVAPTPTKRPAPKRTASPNMSPKMTARAQTAGSNALIGPVRPTIKAGGKSFTVMSETRISKGSPARLSNNQFVPGKRDVAPRTPSISRTATRTPSTRPAGRPGSSTGPGRPRTSATRSRAASGARRGF